MPQDHQIDAFIYFASSGSRARRMPESGVEGETSDADATKDIGKDPTWSWPSNLTSYHFGFELDRDWAEDDHEAKDKQRLQHRPKLSPLTITKQFDTASPSLLEAVQKATVFDKVKLVHRRAGGANGHQTAVVITMGVVAVQSLDWSAGSDGLTVETVQLDFCEIQVDYMPQKSKGSDDDENKVSGEAKVTFPKTDSDRVRSFSGPDPVTQQQPDVTKELEAIIDQVNKKTSSMWTARK